MDKMFCENCGNTVFKDAVICPNCGKQIGEFKTDKDLNHSHVIINNNINNNNNNYSRKECDKWISFLLCLFLGLVGAHKFYEGKIGLGIVYIFTGAFFGIGWFIDLITILCQKNPYYV